MRTLLKRLAIAFVALLLLGLAAAWWALGSETVHRALLARLNAGLESSGLVVDVRSVRVRPTAGSLELEGVTVRNVSDGELASVESARATVLLRPLLRRRLVATEVVLETLRFDLAELPEPSGEEETAAEPLALPGVEIRQLLLRDGRLAGLPMPGGSEVWASGDALSEIELEASLSDGVLAVVLERAAAELARAGGAPARLSLEGRLGGPLAGPFDLTGVRLLGPDLELSLTGTIGMAPDQPMAIAFGGTADAGALIDGGYRADVSVGGEIDVRAAAGRLDLDAPTIPAELLARWLDPALFDQLEAAGTTLGVDAELRLGPDGLDRVTGSVDGTWSRAEVALVELATDPDLVASERSGRIPFEVALTPGLAGSRRASGVLVLEDWVELATAALEDGRVDVRFPDLATGLAAHARLWPAAGAKLPGGLTGGLELTGSVSGALVSPAIDFDGAWRPGAGSSVLVRATGSPVERWGSLRLSAEALAVATFDPAMNGSLDGEVELTGTGRTWSGSFELTASDVGRDGTTPFDLATRGSLGPDAVEIGAFDGSWGEHRLAAVAGIELTGSGLLLTAESLTVDGVTGELTVEVPGGLLAGLPVIGARSWSGAPGDRSVRLAWNVPGGESLELGGGRLELATAGEAAIDLDRPQASTGEARVSTLRWSGADAALALERPLELELGAGVLTAGDLRLVTTDSWIEGGARIELSDAWRPGDSPNSLLAAAGVDGRARIGSDWLGRALGVAGFTDEPLLVDAEVDVDRATVAGRLDLDGAGSRLEIRGTAGLDPAPEAGGVGVSALDLTATGSLSAAWIATVLGVDGGEAGALGVDVALAGALDRLSGRVRIDGAGTEWRLGGATVGAPRADLELADRALTLHQVGALLNGEPLAGSGSGRIAPGRFELDRLELSFAGIESVWSASVPVGAGDDPPPEDEAISLEWRVAEADLHPALELFELIVSGDAIRAGTTGSLRWSPARPAGARGWVEITGLDWSSRGRRTSSAGPIRFEIAEGQAILEPLQLISGGQIFDLRGQARLAPSWTGEQGLDRLVEHLDLEGSGTLLTSLLNPFLGGAVADGFLALELEARGRPGDLQARVSLRGSEASLVYPRPYATRISEPELELSLEPGGGYRLDGTVRLNEGLVVLAGGTAEGGRTELSAELSGVRYRLDYGLLALLNGNLALKQEEAGGWALTGVVQVEHGVLTRDMDLDLDLILSLLAPVDLTSTEESPLEAFRLDLDVTTIEGVRVKNNVADLLVRWDPVKVTGTLAAPVVGGRLDVEPGGRVRAFGQTVRVEQASIDYPGIADLPATIDMDITSSFEDPSIASLAADDPFRSDRDVLSSDEESRLASAATGLGAYYGERVASRLTAGANGARVSLEPLLIFGETDPGARLTVSQDFSPHVTIAASVDLRNAEAQTYLLDFHGLDALPGFNGQLFTTDEQTEGGALRQRVRLGPGGARAETGPRIRKIRYQLPPGISKRRVRRAIGFAKGDRLGDGDRFAAEVEVVEALRRRGYSDARATVETRELDNGVELLVSARPGPKADFVFEGQKLSKALRRSVTDLYRSDYYEAVAIEEMVAEARRALRSLGFLEPSVRVEVELREPEEPTSDRRVILAMEGGERIDLERVRFVPLPDDEAAILETRFSRPVRRIELAAAVADADRRVVQTLRYVGYADPRVVGRELSADGHELVVTVETGDRPRLASVEIVGVEAEESERLVSLIDVRPGQPIRPDRIGVAAVKLRDDLRSRGYADAIVEARLDPADPAPGGESALRFDIDPGTGYFIGEVRFAGLETTRPAVARKVADLELEEDFSQEGVLEARRRLWKTNLFDRVTPEVIRAPGGIVRVEFDVRERKPFEVAYGLRWDSEDDLGVLVELIDRNSLGLGWTLGLRAQWSENDQSLRGFAGLPRFLSPRSSLGLFAAAREQTEGGLLTETIEGTVQLSWELTTRLTARVYGQLTESHVTELDPNPFLPFDVRLTRPILGSQVLYDSRRGQTLFQRGTLATGDLSVSDGAFGSDFDYVRFFGQVNTYRPVRKSSSGSLIWAQSVRVGLAEAYDGELVRQDRFFAGGEFSVRGYLSESLGPEENLGITIRPAGGEALLVLNEELRWSMTDRLTGLVFLDVGNVWAKVSDFGSDLATSLGIGIRALTPVGILRLDLAHAIDRRPIDPEFKIYFGLGSTF